MKRKKFLPMMAVALVGIMFLAGCEKEKTAENKCAFCGGEFTRGLVKKCTVCGKKKSY